MLALTTPLTDSGSQRGASTPTKAALVLLLPCMLALIFSAGFAAAKEDCAVGMGTVCFNAVQGGDAVTISAQNRETYEVTITVNAKLNNMTSSVRLPYTRMLEGGFRDAIMTF